MAYLLYDLALHGAALLLLPYFLLKMALARKWREGIAERFGFVHPGKLRRLARGKVVWVHAVSVGETKAVLPVLRTLRRLRPDVRILFSTVTATGNRTAAREGRGLIDALIYYPLDLSWSIGRVARLARPSLFVTVEKEIWPNTFRAMRRTGAPVVVVNGTISDRAFRRFTRFAFFFRGVFGMVSLFLARTEEDLDKALAAGVPSDNAVLGGNLKFDLAPAVVDRQFVAGLRDALGTRPGTRLLVAGSTHSGEEEIVLSSFKSLLADFPGLRLVIAPRHPERFDEVESAIRRAGLSCARRSKGGSAEVLLLDSMGELMTVYSLADIAFVGGSIVPGIGGHNLLEPAYFGKPVVYGPHLTTYLGMAEMLEKEGGGIRAGGGAALTEALRSLLSDEVLMKRSGASARKIVELNRGASARAASAIEKLLRR